MSELSRKIAITRWNGSAFLVGQDDFAIECLVTIKVDETIVAKLLATPSDLQDLAIGHCLSEAKTQDIYVKDFSIEYDSTGAYTASITTTDGNLQAKSDERIITSSCGACDRDGVDQLMADIPYVESSTLEIATTLISKCFEEMKQKQTGYRITGGLHAAGLMDAEGRLVALREDIGRHNALDKLFGHAIREQIDLNQHVVLLSGRCGWDIVAKTAMMNCQVIASIGAASTLAIESARLSNITLFSFVRDDKGVLIGPSNRLV